MKIIGVTGGIGSGKSCVSEIFANLGGKVIDADKISHEIMNVGSAAYCEVLEYFGAEILDENKSINRKKLADIVFNNRKKLDKLNMITHKYIFEEMRKKIEEYKDEKAIILDVPLLFDKDFTIKYDKSAAVVADEEIRIKRAAARDNSSLEKIKNRIKNQISDSEYRRIADFVIENNGTREELFEKCRKVYDEIFKENEEGEESLC